MAWWDHDELKPLDARSNLYKETFPEEYPEGKAGKIWDRKIHKWVKQIPTAKVIPEKPKIIINGEELQPMTDKEMFNMAQLYPDKDEVTTDCQIPNDSYDHYIQMVKANKKIPENSKFRETELLREVESYIANTYDEHYSQGDIQIFESIAANGHGEGFACGNIQKLAARYGKKHGYNRDDLLKIIHYGILLLWDHDKNKRK